MYIYVYFFEYLHIFSFLFVFIDDSEWKIHSVGMKNTSNLDDSAVTLLFERNFIPRNVEGT